jgi:2-C-methyl-D-erythritol 4-phosphate cytidylyltransferase / 2-C-methyl-D-erythritol 2,4-cyclodiphosphate synthase
MPAPAGLPGLRIAVLVTAAGASERFGGGKKELLPLGDRSMLDRALSPFLELHGLEALVVTAPPGREAELRAALSPPCLRALDELGPGRFALVAGGQSRRDSVRNGLEELARILGGGGGDRAAPSLDEVVVLVHDGARPWATNALAARVAEAAYSGGASVPIVPLVDTPKEIGPDGIVLRHPPRSSLRGAQTPQGFRLGPLLAAHRKAAEEGLDCTDDAELWDRYIGPVLAVPGEAENRKVTYARDLLVANDLVASSVPSLAPPPELGDRASADRAVVRIGQGWDLHALVPGRRLMLGGVSIPSGLGEDAHSDGDVLLHAIIDAMLGAAALGDIGTHFPPSDEAWRDADSKDLARRASNSVREAGWEIGNLDCTVILERPKLGPHKEAIRESVAACLGISPGSVSIKAKTKEGVDAVGEGRAIEAAAAVLLVRAN